MLPSTTEEEEDEREAVLETSMFFSATHGVGEERPECVAGDTASMVTLHNLQDGQTIEHSESKRSRASESGSEASSAKNKLFRSSLSTKKEEPVGFVATTRDIRGQMAHQAAGGADAQRPVSRRTVRRRKKRGRGCGGSGGDRGSKKLPFLPPSPLQLQQSWPLVPSSLSSSLMGAHSIYSGTGGLSKTRSFGVITGAFANRQRSFRSRHVRPRTADGSSSPTRSAVLIYVTTRSNFDVSGHRPQAIPRSVSSRGGGSKKWHTKRSTARPHHHGGVSNFEDNRGGWAGDGTTSSTDISYEVRSGQHSVSPPLQQRPKTVPLAAMHAPLHAAGEGPRTWFRDERATNARGARRQHLQALRDGNSATGKNFSDDYHQNNVWRVRAQTAAARRTGLTASASFPPEDLILSPERAAARLASIRKAYGPQNVTPFRGSSLHATALKSSPSASFSARTRGRG